MALGDVIYSFSVAAYENTPTGLTFDGKNLWVIGWQNGVHCIDRSGVLIRSFASPVGAPYGMTFDGKNLWITGGNNVYCVDPLTGTTLYSWGLGAASYGLAFDGANLWVCMGNRVDLMTRLGAAIWSFAFAGGSQGLGFDGKNLIMSNSGLVLVYILDRLGAIINSFVPPAGNPCGNTFDGKCLWHASYTSDRIYQISLN